MNVGPTFFSGEDAAAGVAFTGSTVLGTGVLSNGNRTFSFNPAVSSFEAAWIRAGAARSGKRYWEIVVSGTTARGYHIGLVDQGFWESGAANDYPANPYGNPYYLICNGNTLGMTIGLITNGTASGNAAYDFTNGGQVIGVAVNFDTGEVWFAKDNVWMAGDPAAGTGETFTLPSGAFDPFVTCYGASANFVVTLNAAPADFVYTPPTGFSELT